jgi:hypothetical protein
VEAADDEAPLVLLLLLMMMMMMMMTSVKAPLVLCHLVKMTAWPCPS